MKIKPVMVEWVDSMGSHGWGNLSEPSNLSCFTVGQLVAKTPERVTVALNQNSHGLYGEHIEIPMCAVKRIKHLK